MPDRTVADAAVGGGAAVAGLAALNIEIVQAGLSVLIGFLSVIVLIQRICLNRRERRDGTKQNDPPEV